MTGKDEIIAALGDSFAHVRAAVMAVSDDDMEKTFPWFGGNDNT